MLLYYAVGFILLALTTLGLGFMGIARGAAGVANLSFLVGLILLGVAAFKARHRTIHHTRGFLNRLTHH